MPLRSTPPPPYRKTNRFNQRINQQRSNFINKKHKKFPKSPKVHSHINYNSPFMMVTTMMLLGACAASTLPKSNDNHSNNASSENSLGNLSQNTNNSSHVSSTNNSNIYSSNSMSINNPSALYPYPTVIQNSFVPKNTHNDTNSTKKSKPSSTPHIQRFLNKLKHHKQDSIRQRFQTIFNNNKKSNLFFTKLLTHPNKKINKFIQNALLNTDLNTDESILKLLYSPCSKQTIATLAVELNLLDLVTDIYKAYPELLETPNELGLPPRVIAASYGNIDMLFHLYTLDKNLITLAPISYESYLTDAKVDLLAEYKNAISTHDYIKIEFLYQIAPGAFEKWPPELLCQTDENGYTLATRAALNGNSDALKMLYKINPELLRQPDEIGFWKPDKNGFTPATTAAFLGNSDALKTIYELDSTLLRQSDKNGFTPATMAAKKGKVDVIKTLHKIDSTLLHQSDNNVETPATEAAKEGKIDVIKTLHKLDSTLLHQSNKGGVTPVTWAACHSKIDVLETLHKLDSTLLPQPGKNGYIPDPFASHDSKKELLKTIQKLNKEAIRDKQKLFEVAAHAQYNVHELLNKNINVNVKLGGGPMEGSTPLHYAVINENLYVVNAFIAGGADVDAINKEEMTPLHYAVSRDDPHSYLERIVNALLAKNPNVNATNKEGWTPLHYAAKNGLKNEVTALLAKNANVNATNKDGWTPLHFAAKKGHTAIMNALLAKNADVNATNKDGWTPLYYAARWGHIDIMSALLNKNINSELLHLPNTDKYKPETWSEYNEINPGYQTGVSTSTWAVLESNTYAYEILYRINPELLLQKDKNGNSAISEAISKGNFDLLTFFHNLDKKLISKADIFGDSKAAVFKDSKIDIKPDLLKLFFELDPYLVLPKNPLDKMTMKMYDAKINTLRKYPELANKNFVTIDHQGNNIAHVVIENFYNHGLYELKLILKLNPALFKRKNFKNESPLDHLLLDFFSFDNESYEKKFAIIVIKEIYNTNTNLILDYRDINGNSIAHEAAFRSDIIAIEFLFKLDPKLCFQYNKQGQSIGTFLAQYPALDYDIDWKKSTEKTYQFLINLNHNIITDKDQNGHTPLEIAIAKSNHKTAEFLEDLICHFDSSTLNKLGLVLSAKGLIKLYNTLQNYLVKRKKEKERQKNYKQLLEQNIPYNIKNRSDVIEKIIQHIHPGLFETKTLFNEDPVDIIKRIAIENEFNVISNCSEDIQRKKDEFEKYLENKYPNEHYDFLGSITYGILTLPMNVSPQKPIDFEELINLIIKGTNLNGSFNIPLSKTQKKLDIKTFNLIRLEYKMWQRKKANLKELLNQQVDQ